MAESAFVLSRLATADSACVAALTAVFLASRRQAMPWLPELHGEAETQAYLAGLPAEQHVWLAHDAAGCLAGFVSFDAHWVHHLYLAPVAQGQGLGAQLLGQALADGQPRQLWCFAANLRARRFYQGQGFVQIDATDGAGNEERTPDVLLQHPGGGI
ncbi:GNAT family N-acetyltransferase [Chitinimonas viridis]|uniref:GNAT family N-acetyltransferase n=1 Tax=Chitinimonas viridis TaxID=664880 RepID=A0ABT8B725_9NEIS|nr:GNAT family N-acetyltransferase [Chitinimonas viridis]MDN3577630.1 GNAT family N-acetyltransferase [Chitinimonas viridis]